MNELTYKIAIALAGEESKMDWTQIFFKIKVIERIAEYAIAAAIVIFFLFIWIYFILKNRLGK